MSNKVKFKKTFQFKRGMLGLTINIGFYLIILSLPIVLFATNYLITATVVLSSFYLLNIYFLNLVWKYKRSDFQTKLSWTFLLLFPATWFFYLRGGYILWWNREKIKKSFLLENSLISSKSNNSKIKIFYESKEKFDSLINDLKRAKEFINFQYFIINNGIAWNKIKPILIERKKAGVEIRILIDDVGNVQTAKSSYKELLDIGIPIIRFNEVKWWKITGIANYRSHNKFVVIDNKVGYMGGTNIGDDYLSLYPKYGYWIDLHLRAEGEIVYDFNSQFITQWFLETGETIAQEKKYPVETQLDIHMYSDGPQYDQSIFLNHLLKKIKLAKTKIKIVTPYFIIPNVLMNELRKAVKRGVNVEIITAGRADKITAFWMSFYYSDIAISNGIKIYRMNNIFIHSKFNLIDDTVILGTSNLDYRAFYFHYENNCIIKDSFICEQLNDFFEKYKENATLMINSSINWNISKKLKNIFVRLVSVMF